MKGVLKKKQIEYIFYHLNHHIKMSEEIRDRIIFDNTGKKIKGKVIFNLSKNELDDVKYIQNIPILYPLREEGSFYKIDENRNLIFYHDLLKSLFHLLSGYQETQDFKGDEYNRFSFNDSIQKKLDIVMLPLVNEYFHYIGEGIEKFCQFHGIEFYKRSILGDGKFGFMLTHDVDRVDKYTFPYFKLRLKQYLNLNYNEVSFKEKTKALIKAGYKMFTRENPYWNFDWMKSIEKANGFNSTWFFLPKGKKHLDAYYSFDEPRIKALVQMLQDAGDEIGLHGTFSSRENPETMKANYNSVKTLIGKSPVGVRQHWLSFKYPDTIRFQEKLGLKYDSSWTFADHIGWRNSYCLPFRPYDFENDRMMDIWEFPLAAMDVSFFQYMGLSLDEAFIAIKDMIETCIKHSGLFVLLWHNSHFDESILPGITNFYKELLEMINKKSPINFNYALFKTIL